MHNNTSIDRITLPFHNQFESVEFANTPRTRTAVGRGKAGVLGYFLEVVRYPEARFFLG